MELNDYGKAGEEAIHRLLLVYGDWFPDRVPSGDVPSSMYGIERVAALVADVRLFCERWGHDWFDVCDAADDLFIGGVEDQEVEA